MFQVDAFAEHVFEGNPAAVVPLTDWLDDKLLQAVAEENNLSETAFFVRTRDCFELRWFTPGGEVDLCGHATLGSAYVLYEKLGFALPEIRFYTRSGDLVVKREGKDFCMTFPATVPKVAVAPPALIAGLGIPQVETLIGFDYIAVYKSEDDVANLMPDFAVLQELDLRGVVATAPGTSVDFVSRCFFPKHRINEDPVTGSARCEIAPFWSKRFGGSILTANQISSRGGHIGCEVRGSQVIPRGRGAHYMTAEITI